MDPHLNDQRPKRVEFDERFCQNHRENEGFVFELCIPVLYFIYCRLNDTNLVSTVRVPNQKKHDTRQLQKNTRNL